MTILKINTNKFIDWYFTSGSDQEQESLATELGWSIIQRLLNGDKEVVTKAQDFIDVCNTDIIPIRLVDGYDTRAVEIGDLFGEYKIKLK